ncbi:hypothetical protein SNEBB_003318 [Seison nebaliae]|nr:hypothetical protein SNEBB_003318 [Seison nebaliae]
MNNKCLFIGVRSAGKTFILRRLQDLNLENDETGLLQTPIMYTEPTVGLEYFNVSLPNTNTNRLIRIGELGSDLIESICYYLNKYNLIVFVVNGTNAECLPDVRRYVSHCVEWLNEAGESQRHLLIVINKCFETFSLNYLEIKESLKLKELFEEHLKTVYSKQTIPTVNEHEYVKKLCGEHMKIFNEHYSTSNTSITSTLINAHSGRNLSSIIYWLHLFAK